MKAPNVPVICTCGYDGKLTSPLCPLHGEHGLTARIERLEAINRDLLAALEKIRITARKRVGGGNDFDSNHQLLRQIQRLSFGAIERAKGGSS